MTVTVLSVDLAIARNNAEKQTDIALGKEREAVQEADKAKKARTSWYTSREGKDGREGRETSRSGNSWTTPKRENP